MPATFKSRLGTRSQPEQSRAAILQAAVREFAREGVAGARTDAIARSAGVNKALLYYYFKDKEALYQAVLDEVFSGVRVVIQNALAQDLPPRERLKAYVLAHFDYIASKPQFPRVVQAELLRSYRGPAEIQRLAKRYFRPIFEDLSALIEEGIRAGEFRPVQAMHFTPLMVSVIVSYFITAAPVITIVTGADPFAPELLAERRAAVLDFITAALFVPVDSQEGTRLAGEAPAPHRVRPTHPAPHSTRRAHSERSQ